MPCEDAPCCGCCPANESLAAPEQDDLWLLGLAEDEDTEDRDFDDSMDGDHDSAMASAGFGTDEDYGFAEDLHCEGYDEY